MSTTTSVQSRTRNKLIAQKLKFEAALRSVTIGSHRCGDHIVIPSNSWRIEVFVNDVTGDGVQLKMQAHLGMHQSPDAEFLDFVASANSRDDQVTLELSADGAIGVRVAYMFPTGVVVKDAVTAVMTFAEAVSDIGNELRDAYFVQPVENNALRAGGMK